MVGTGGDGVLGEPLRVVSGGAVGQGERGLPVPAR